MLRPKREFWKRHSPGIPAILALLLLSSVSAPAVEISKIPGWKTSGQQMTYDKKGLFQAINGAAELYLTYGFLLLKVQDFTRAEYRIAVNLFDMGASIQAFGIFKRELPSNSTPVKQGDQAAFMPPYHCLLWKNRFFVKIEALQGQLDEARCVEILTPLAKEIPTGNSLAAWLNKLPIEQQLPDSIGYTPKGYLGLTDLNNCLHASYRTKKSMEYQVFVIVSAQAGARKNAWKRIANRWSPLAVEDMNVLRTKVPYTGKVFITKTERLLIGVVSNDSNANALALLKQLTRSEQKK